MTTKKFTSRDILERLTDSTAESAPLLAAIITAGYGASVRQIERKAEKIRSQYSSSPGPIPSVKERHSFNSLLSYLKRDGLIEKSASRWAITKKGRNKLTSYRGRFPNRQYTEEESGNLKIIAFDIPENLRGKRAWLRSVLRNMGFRMVQQSMWAGKRGIPKQFLEDLRTLKIVQYVDIFTVTKSGSLRALRT